MFAGGVKPDADAVQMLHPKRQNASTYHARHIYARPLIVLGPLCTAGALRQFAPPTAPLLVEAAPPVHLFLGGEFLCQAAALVAMCRLISCSLRRTRCSVMSRWRAQREDHRCQLSNSYQLLTDTALTSSQPLHNQPYATKFDPIC